jgi:hypothetical protein
MGELGNIRPIPSRGFAAGFLSDQNPTRVYGAAWVPKYEFQGAALKVSFGAGTVNGFLPGNWNDEFLIPESNERYVKLEVNASRSGISSVTLNVSSSPKINNSFNKNYPSTSFSFILGALKGLDYSMAFSSGIVVTPMRAYTSPKKPESPGEQPFDQYWHWTVA